MKRRHAVVPRMYSLDKPLLRPRRTDLTICGSQMEEYVQATKSIERVGDRITRTMTDKKTSMATPWRSGQFEFLKRWKGSYIIWLVGLSLFVGLETQRKIKVGDFEVGR